MNDTTDAEPSAPTENSPPAAVSRRDFLRRAGREAAETGAKVIPGANVARVVLGVGETPDADAPAGAKNVPNWLRKVAAWKARQGQGTTGGATE